MKNIAKKYLFLCLALTGFCKAMEQSVTLDYYSTLNVAKDADLNEITEKFNVHYSKAYSKIVTYKSTLNNPKLLNKQESFRKKAVAFIVLSDPEMRRIYDEQSSNFEEPFHFYTTLQVPLAIKENLSKHNTKPPYKISPENCREFFTHISSQELSQAMKAAPREEEDKIMYAYDILSDYGLRTLYHQNPTESTFNEALKNYKNDPTLIDPDENIKLSAKPLAKAKSKRTLMGMLHTAKKVAIDKASSLTSTTKELTLTKKESKLKRSSSSRTTTIN